MQAAEAEKALEEAEEGLEDADIEEEHYEGYLGMFRGVLQNLKRKWCVLHGNTFMFFKKQQVGAFHLCLLLIFENIESNSNIH